MKLTREELAALLKKSAKNIKESQQIHQQLLALRLQVDRVLAGQTPAKRKNPK